AAAIPARARRRHRRHGAGSRRSWVSTLRYGISFAFATARNSTAASPNTRSTMSSWEGTRMIPYPIPRRSMPGGGRKWRASCRSSMLDPTPSPRGSRPRSKACWSGGETPRFRQRISPTPERITRTDDDRPNARTPRVTSGHLALLRRDTPRRLPRQSRAPGDPAFRGRARRKSPRRGGYGSDRRHPAGSRGLAPQCNRHSGGADRPRGGQREYGQARTRGPAIADRATDAAARIRAGERGDGLRIHHP